MSNCRGLCEQTHECNFQILSPVKIFLENSRHKKDKSLPAKATTKIITAEMLKIEQLDNLNL